MDLKKSFIGEFIGTFLLVLFGCGSVAVSVLFSSHQGLFQIAMVWGIGVTLAIFVTRNLSCAHLNPAVTIAMAASGRMKKGLVPSYIVGQLLGAFIAALMIFMIFNPSIVAYEQNNDIIRGTPSSVATAKMFGEYYGYPGDVVKVSMPLAMLAEGFGTFLLVFVIFSLTEGCNTGRPDDKIAPLFIGLTVSSIICLIAPLTQAGINPARDFAPRIVAWLFGWVSAAFPDNTGGFFFVYILAPIIGGLIAGMMFTKIVEPLMNNNKTQCCN